MENSLKHEKSAKECFGRQAPGPPKARGPEHLPGSPMVNPAQLNVNTQCAVETKEIYNVNVGKHALRETDKSLQLYFTQAAKSR